MKTETIKIDPDGKYIIILEFEDENKISYDYVERVTKVLQEWWNNPQDKFFVIYNNLKDGTRIRLERVDNG